MDTKLHEAVRYGDVTDVIRALDQGYDPNLIGLYEWTPVHEAAHNGERAILKLLLRHKGNPNLQDKLRGNTPVHYAAEEGHLQCLKILLEVGGQPQISNSDNQSALDVASGECQDFLEQFVMDRSNDQTDQVVSDMKELGKDDHNNNMDTQNDEENTGRRSSTGVVRSDSKEELPAMGHLHLSFEYHIHKGSLKIRVWQVSDLLLPPPHTSMINSIFVRSYLIPDKPKKTNRRTEEVKVAPSEAHVATNRTAEEPGIQYVFTPSNFHFTMPLIYTGVTEEIVNERSVQIEVCMTQRYTKRIFLVAMINMPLKAAVKRPIREKYPLIPCMNYTIPNNMRVYSASELQLESNMGMFYSSPLLRDLDKDPLTMQQTARSSSDMELQGITIHNDEQLPSVAINMQNGSHGISNGLDLQEVKVKRKIVPDFSSIDIPVTNLTLPGQLDEVKVEGDDPNACIVDMTNGHRRKRIKPPRFNGDMEMEVESPKPTHLSANSDEGAAETTVERPETPVWDYYDFDDFELGMEPIEGAADAEEGKTEDVADGMNEVADGTNEVADGTNKVADSVNKDADTTNESNNEKTDFKGVSFSQSAVKAMTGQPVSKVSEDAHRKKCIPALNVDDIENEDDL